MPAILERLAHLYVDASEIVRSGESAFFSEPILRHAATSVLIQIGETAKHLPASFISSTNVPYEAMTMMRHKLAHALDDINWATVWSTISLDVPEIALKQRRTLLERQGDQPS